MRLSTAAMRRIGWFALGCHLLVASGLPLPLAVAPVHGDGDAVGRLAAKDRSRPFPCMDKACGCASADQCFSGCCCHTPAQQLAWARAHDVEAAVLAALERRVATTAKPAAGCGTARQAEPACCSTPAEPAAGLDGPEVCRDYRSLAAEPVTAATADDVPADDVPARRTVILRDMLACGGIATAWLACGTSLPPPACVAAPAHDARAGTIALRDEVAASVSADLSAPPPRVG